MKFFSRVFVIMLIMSFSVAGCKKTNKKLSSIKVMTIVGQADIKNSGQILQVNDLIQPGDTIVTGNKSFVELFVSPKSAIKIYANTEFTVTKFKSDGKNVFNTEFSIDEGESLFLMHKLLKNSTTRVLTPTSVASVRGTTFSVAFSRKKSRQTELKVVDGKVSMRPKDKSQENTMVGPSTMLVVSGKGIVIEKRDISSHDLEKMKEEKKKLKDRVVIAVDKLTINTDKVIINTNSNQNKTKKEIPLLKTEKEIKQYYHKLEVVNLDDGSVLVGAVVAQNARIITIHTTHGIVNVPTTSVKNIKMR